MEDVIVKYHDPEAERLGRDADDFRLVDLEVTFVAIQGLRSYTLYRAKSCHQQLRVMKQAFVFNAWSPRSPRRLSHQQKQHLRLVETQSGSTEVVGLQRWCVQG